MSDMIIDLNDLVPKKVTVLFGEDTIDILPPRMVDVITLGPLGQKMQTADELSAPELDELNNEILAIIERCIPRLTGRAKDLNTAQILKLVEIISTMSMPSDAKELASRGISPAGPKVP